MRPMPEELVAGVVRILRDTVAPSVADAHARSQLAQAIAVLRTLDAHETGAAVRAADAALRSVIDACSAWLQRDESRVAQFAPIVAIPAGPDEALAEVSDRYESNRAALEAFLATLEEWRAAHGTATSDEILRVIGAHLAGRDPNVRID